MKKTFYSLSHALAFDRLFALINRDRPIVLTFHGVTRDTSGSLYNHEGKHLHLPIFERLMRHVAAHYNPVPLSRIADWLQGVTELPPAAVAITFDDGYRNVFTEAAPVLRELRIPATVYIVTDFVFENRMLWTDRLVSALGLTGKKSIAVEWGGPQGGALELPLGTAAERLAADEGIRTLCKALPDPERVALLARVLERLGVDESALEGAWGDHRPLRMGDLAELPRWGIEVGSHTMTHTILPRCTEPQMDRELRVSKRLIENMTQRPCLEFSYPNGAPGDFNPATRERIVKAGYRSAVTTVKSRLAPGCDPYEIPRYILTHNEITIAEFSTEVSGFPTLLRTIRGKLIPSAGA